MKPMVSHSNRLSTLPYTINIWFAEKKTRHFPCGETLTTPYLLLILYDLQRPVALPCVLLLQRSVNIPFGIPLCGVFPFIVEFFTPAQPYLYFYSASREIYPQGNEG